MNAASAHGGSFSLTAFVHERFFFNKLHRIYVHPQTDTVRALGRQTDGEVACAVVSKNVT